MNGMSLPCEFVGNQTGQGAGEEDDGHIAMFSFTR